jgi:Skp family chaperone for outer membrane proteins
MAPKLRLVGILLLAGIALAAAAAPAQQAPMAVVDLDKVLEAHPKAKVLQERIELEMQKREGEYESLLQGMEKLKELQKELDPQSAAYLELEKEIQKKKDEAKIRRRDSLRALEKESVDAMKEVLLEVESVIEKYCRKAGLLCCFNLKVGPRAPVEEEAMDLAWKVVIWRDDSVDITDEIVEIVKGG